MTQPWKEPRTGIWKLRRRIPQRYRAVADQKGDTIKISTGTADRKEAERRWPDVLRQWADKEAEWERRLNVVARTPGRAREIAAHWAARTAGGAPLDTGGKNSDTFDPLTLPEARTAGGLARMWDRIEHHAAEALREANISATMETRPLLLQAMLQPVAAAYLQADLIALGATGSNSALNPLAVARHQLPAVPDAPVTRPKEPALPVRALLETWRITAAVKPSVAAETAYAIDGLVSFLGHDDALRIGRENLVRWRDAMKEAGRTNATWNNRLSLIRQVLVRAVSDGRLPADPTHGLRLPKNIPQSWLPYSDDEAARILNAARREIKAERRWAPWIMAFSGMRVGEVLQLSVADVREEGGIRYFAIHEDDPGNSVKNSQRRNVPIHPALIAEGLLTYAQSLPANGPLFPDKKPDKHGRRGARGWNTVGEWVRDVVGIDDLRKAPNHSWRHRMEDELRNAEVPEDARDAILGHARKTVGRVYGVRGESLRRLAEAVGRLGLPPGVTPMSAGLWAAVPDAAD